MISKDEKGTGIGILQGTLDARKDTQDDKININKESINSLNKKSQPIGVKRIKSNYRVLNKDRIVLVDAQPGAVVVTLPKASSMKDREITIKKVDASANAMTVEANFPEEIDGAANVSTTTQNKAYTLKSDQKGNSWWVI